MHPLDTKAYLLKRYSPSDSFWTFFSWECWTSPVQSVCFPQCQIMAIISIIKWLQSHGLHFWHKLWSYDTNWTHCITIV